VKPRIALAGLAAALFAISACSGPVDGQAQPASETTANSTTRSPAGPTTTTRSGTTLDDIDPCTLLTPDEAEQVAGPLREKPTREDLGTARGCEFKPKSSSFAVDIRTNVGLSGVQAPGEVADVKIGSHDAKQFIGTTRSCVIAMGVTASSRVDVVMTTSSDKDPCQLARKIAELVEPRLP
jgi:hypothetical protein